MGELPAREMRATVALGQSTFPTGHVDPVVARKSYAGIELWESQFEVKRLCAELSQMGQAIERLSARHRRVRSQLAQKRGCAVAQLSPMADAKSANRYRPDWSTLAPES